MQLSYIEANLIKSDSGNLPDNFVAAAVCINADGIAFHAGLIIGVNNMQRLFHFDGEEIRLENITTGEWYFHKDLEIIPKEDSEVFLAHCERIQVNSTIEYGFIFDGSYYQNGVYFSNSGLPEFSTCVGFCINVITGFLFDLENYFEINDWETVQVNAHPNFQFFFSLALKNHPDLNEEIYKTHHKRIRPDEYIASAFFGINDLPVRKAKVDLIINNVQTSLRSKRSQHSFP